MQVDALLQELTPSPNVEARAAGAVERMRALLLNMPLQQQNCSLVQKFATALNCQMKVRHIDNLREWRMSGCASLQQNMYLIQMCSCRGP